MREHIHDGDQRCMSHYLLLDGHFFIYARL